MRGKAIAVCLAVMASAFAGIDAGATPTPPSRVRDAINRATRAYERQDYQEAAHVYAGLPPRPDRPAEVCYNEGLALAALGERDRAAEAFRLADLNAREPGIRADARFNLARLQYEAAMEQALEDPDAAIEQLRHAASVYRSVLDVRPGDVEAAKNVERARLAIRNVQERIEQEQQRQEQQRQQMEQLAQQLRELADRQRENAEQSDRAAEQMRQDSSIGSEMSRQSREQQSELSEETENLISQLQQMLQQSPDSDPNQSRMSEVEGQMQDAREAQKGAGEELDANRPGRAAPSQRRAAEQLEEAAERLEEASRQRGEGSGRGERQEPRRGRPEPGEGEGQGEEQEQQEPTDSRPQEVDRLGMVDGDPIARRLLEREILNRMNRVRRGPPIPVEKDW